MADIFLDPRLPDYFVEHDWAKVSSDDASRDAVLNQFVDEKLCMLHGYNLSSLDFDFLGQITLPQTWEMKKFQFLRLLQEADDRAGDTTLLNSVRDAVFGGDDIVLERFLAQLRELKRISDDITKRLLAGVHVESTLYVSRFSETRMENLHFDLDADSDNHESFRLYINLDRAPRVWATSYQLTGLLEGGGQRLTQDLEGSMPGETILKRATGRAFGGWNQRATERTAPRHMVFFDPGDIWLVDGRCVSHQVLTGHRVLSIYARLPHRSNPALGPTFRDKLRNALTKARELPIGSETAQIEYYKPDQLTSAANLKEDWADVFGQTRTGRARRFNDSGLALS